MSTEVEVARTRAVVGRVIDEEEIGCLQKKIAEDSPSPMPEEELEECLKEIRERDGPTMTKDELQKVEAQFREQVAKGVPENLASYKREIRELEALKTSRTVPHRGRGLGWKEAVRNFREMPEQELMRSANNPGCPILSHVLARLALQERRPDMMRVDPNKPPLTEEEVEAELKSLLDFYKDSVGPAPSADEMRRAIIESTKGQRWLVVGGASFRWIDKEAGAGPGENEEIGRGAEFRATEFLQSKLRDQADVIRRGGQGEPDLEVIFRAPQSPREFVAVKSTMELRTKRPSVTYSNLGTCPEATEARSHGRPLFFLLVEDRNAGRWCMRPVPVGTERMKVVAADFGRFELPRAFGR